MKPRLERLSATGLALTLCVASPCGLAGATEPLYGRSDAEVHVEAAREPPAAERRDAPKDRRTWRRGQPKLPDRHAYYSDDTYHEKGGGPSLIPTPRAATDGRTP